jgi:hypothetical protein
MSINALTLAAQEYSTNINLLLQQKGSKLAGTVETGTHVGKQASPVDQVGAIEAQKVTTRFAPMGRVDAPLDRRWVFPTDYDLPQLFDSFDKLRLISDPTSKYVQNAVFAMGRKKDYEILTALLGTAKTGEQGAASTVFPAVNEIDVAIGGANSLLNVAKLRAVKKLMMANHVDFDTEEVTCVVTAADHDNLLNEVQIISSDFNGQAKPVLQDGKVIRFLGFNFVHCELAETVLAGTNEVTLPVYVKSGVHLGMWNDVQTSVSKRNDLQGEPWQAYCIQTIGATRLEEKKVYAIESYRA